MINLKDINCDNSYELIKLNKSKFKHELILFRISENGDIYFYLLNSGKFLYKIKTGMNKLNCTCIGISPNNKCCMIGYNPTNNFDDSGTVVIYSNNWNNIILNILKVNNQEFIDYEDNESALNLIGNIEKSVHSNYKFIFNIYKRK